MLLRKSFSIRNGHVSSDGAIFAHPVVRTEQHPNEVTATSPVTKHITKQACFETPTKRGRWSKEEDSRLLDALVAVENPHKMWNKISSMVQTRDAKQCWARWNHCLNYALVDSDEVHTSTLTDTVRKKSKNRKSFVDPISERIDELDFTAEEDLFAREKEYSLTPLGTFADEYLSDVEKVAVPAVAIDTGRQLTGRKRRLEFDAAKTNTPTPVQIDVFDVLDAIDRPPTRFTIRVVDKIEKPKVNFKYSIEFPSVLGCDYKNKYCA